MKRSIWADEYLELRKILKSIRQQANLTQLELADLLEKPRTYVTKYENADRNLDFIEIIKVCLACQKDPRIFLDEFIKKSKIT